MSINRMIPTLETERLILRAIDIDKDFQDFCEFGADEQTMRYIGGVANEAQTWRALATVLRK